MVACHPAPSAPDAAADAQQDAAGNVVAADPGPSFIAPAPGAPAIANPVVSFWAKVGRESRVSMYYAARPGDTDSTEFLRFRVRKRSLAFRPDGTPFAPGDSVLITMTLVDPSTLEVEFQPSGLVFSSANPADLKMSYLEADDDFNHDGVINGVDARIERRLALWKRESALSPWLKQASILSVGLDEVETKVHGFTSYAIAW
jgi:hypothetical protein